MTEAAASSQQQSVTESTNSNCKGSAQQTTSANGEALNARVAERRSGEYRVEAAEAEQFREALRAALEEVAENASYRLAQTLQANLKRELLERLSLVDLVHLVRLAQRYQFCATQLVSCVLGAHVYGVVSVSVTQSVSGTSPSQSECPSAIVDADADADRLLISPTVSAAAGAPLGGHLGIAFRAIAVQLVANFHEARRSNLSMLLDSERWRPLDVVPAEFHALFRHIHTNRTWNTVCTGILYSKLLQHLSLPYQMQIASRGLRIRLRSQISFAA